MSPWRSAERAYYAHHGHCKRCIASGLMPGVQERCAEGGRLWRAYQSQPLPWIFTIR